jgi:TolB-like protein
MTDVFVSYARADEPQAERVAEALRAEGYEVWRDSELPAHRAYADVIEERLKSAQAVVVLWSGEAARSQWVRAEADAARSAGTLVQATLDGAHPPMPFNQIQCADLKLWDGNCDASGWRKLAGSVAELTAGRGTDKPKRRSPKASAVSVCVLPFQNMSGDAEQEYFTDGVVEEITAALSHVNWLFVIARNSAFAYKGQAVDVKRVARELGVRYVLEGSVRKAGSRLRVAGQLVEAAAGVSLWADRFEGDVSEVFELQDLVASRVIGAISPRLEQAEMARAKRKPTESLDAYDHYLRGMASLYRWTREGLEEALPQFYKAIELDPDFAAAQGAAAWCYFWRMANGWMSDREQETAEVSRLVGNVAIAGQDDAVALAFSGLALGYVIGDYEAGSALADRALVLNPNCAAAWSASGCLKACHDDPDIAIEHLSRARRLSPLDPLTFFMQCFTAFAHFVAGRNEAAWPIAEAASRAQPYYLTGLRVAAASNAMAGRLDAASKHIARSLRLDPELTLSNLKHRVGQIRPDYFARYVEALRLAGLPE